jgi:hypothetical protein
MAEVLYGGGAQQLFIIIIILIIIGLSSVFLLTIMVWSDGVVLTQILLVNASVAETLSVNRFLVHITAVPFV